MKLFFDEETKQWTINVEGKYAMSVLWSYIKLAANNTDSLLYRSKPVIYAFNDELGMITFFSMNQSDILESAMYMARKALKTLEIA